MDSANQIERNKTFIVEESVGYGKFKYPSLDWSTKLDDYSKDIGFILDAYEHDLRFGGNTKTVDYVNIFDNNDEYDYITKNKSESLGIFKYATNLAKLAIRNWDIVEENVNYIQGSRTVTVTDTNRLAVGMYISSGRAFNEGTRIVSIDSATEVTLSSAALANSGGGGGASAGNTDLNGTTNGNYILPTNTGSVAPGNTFSVQPGDELIAPVSFSGSDVATFYLSGINNGTYYDASNLINSNKEYLQEEISEYIYATYNLPQGDKTKCYRDLGYLIDAVVYHLRFGGNEKVVNFAQLYYTNTGYPYGEELTYINRTPEETTAAIDAWNKLAEKMVLAMRNSLGVGTYTAIPPFTDSNVIADSVSPYCAEVESSINTMIDIVKDIIANGTGVVEVVEINENKSGFWSNTPTYSNYNIIPDPLLISQECDDVVSSVDSLYDNFESVLNNQVVTKTRPDYVDGENTIFDLYWEDGTEVNTEEDEDLFLTINAVLQRPKYTATYPQEDAYYIDRTVIPNRVVFDVAPIWDQDFGAKTIGEPTAVEKVVGIGVGNYKRLTIDYNLVDGVRSGPFLILDVEDYTVQNIEDSRYLYVFLDGVLQREQYSYTVSGPNIYFNVPIKKEMKIDIRYLYGRDVGQILNVFDFAPDNFYAKGNVSLEVTSGLSNFINYSWMGQYIGSPIHALQIKPDNTYNIIGQISNAFVSGSTLNFEIFGQKSELINGLDVVFAVSGRYNISSVISFDHSASSITYQVDDQGRLVLSDNNQIWAGTSLGKTYKQPFVSLSNNDLIRLEGEEGFRRIKKLPSLTTSKEQRVQQQVSNSLFGTVDVERYNGITRGEGLSVVAKIENGAVVDLEWNQRSYDPLTQPTAYQYYTPPVLHFIPQDGNGGGAIANVLVSKGQVISVDLIDGGSGYTEAPKVVVSRRYDVLSERDIGVSLINVGINPFLETTGMNAFSSISVLGNQVSGINTFTSILFNSPVDSDRVITAEIQLVEQNTELSIADREFSSTTSANLDDVPVIDVFHDATVLSAQVQDIVSVNSISTVSRAITTTFENLIHNDALSNVNYYAVGAYLDIDLDATDTIVYIPDTAKFKTNGYLLIGNEVVRYYRKLSDRFIMVQRGQDNTTPQFWTAGTFIRQVPDLVSSVFGGVATIQSEVGVVSVKGGIEVGTAERETKRQIVSPINTLSESTTELLRIPPPSGAVDGYEESIYISDPILTRLNGFVDLDDSYGVVKRNGDVVFVTNSLFGDSGEYIGNYERTNAGPTIGSFNSIFDDGTANVSAMTLLEMEFHYPALTIRDFTERAKSSYTLSGSYFNLTNPSIQNPVTVSFVTGSIGTSLTVQDTTYFPSSGYLFTSGGTVIEYTSKTSNSFGGCSVIRGSSNISVADEIVPFDLT
ncbi:strucutural protein [Synechococcus phage S-B43]|nr:strucutural protein [Synechococcus phage S-B43]